MIVVIESDRSLSLLLLNIQFLPQATAQKQDLTMTFTFTPDSYGKVGNPMFTVFISSWRPTDQDVELRKTSRTK